MNDMSDFYDSLDLKYPEIGIAMDDIDRTNPGVIRFSIPILTPDMGKTEPEENQIHQEPTNLKNKEKNVEVADIQMNNYVPIRVPREVCGFVGDWHKSLEGDLSLNSANMDGGGSVIDGGSIAVVGGAYTPNATGTQHWDPVDKIIKAPSKWIIVFVGGDVTKPRVIARYTED